jgi:hypothetical protein
VPGLTCNGAQWVIVGGSWNGEIEDDPDTQPHRLASRVAVADQRHGA